MIQGISNLIRRPDFYVKDGKTYANRDIVNRDIITLSLKDHYRFWKHAKPKGGDNMK